MSAAPFWMVCRAPTHAGAKTEPRYRYSSRAEAHAAAADLARASNATFVILESVEFVGPADDATPILI